MQVDWVGPILLHRGIFCHPCGVHGQFVREEARDGPWLASSPTKLIAIHSHAQKCWRFLGLCIFILGQFYHRPSNRNSKFIKLFFSHRVCHVPCFTNRWVCRSLTYKIRLSCKGVVRGSCACFAQAICERCAGRKLLRSPVLKVLRSPAYGTTVSGTTPDWCKGESAYLDEKE